MDKDNLKEHVKRHKILHRHFDELLADFLSHNRGKLPSNTTTLELMEWSNKQTTNPEVYQNENKKRFRN